MTGWKRKLVTLVLYIVAAILITWAIWIGPAPRSQLDEGKASPGPETPAELDGERRPPDAPQRR